MIIAEGIPVLILLYIFYLIVFNVPFTYAVDIGSGGDMDRGKDAYLQDMTKLGRLSESMSFDGNTFRNLTGSSVYFFITPTKSITNDTKITAELKFRGDSDLDISVYRDYAWKPLYIKSLDSYTLVRRFDDTAIYARNPGAYTDHDSISSWISGNIPEHSSIRLYYVSPAMLVNRDLTYNNTFTEINQTFRGTHSFLIYIKDRLDLTLIKQDLNWYNGSDEYSVEVYDMEGRQVFKDIIPDDGIADSSNQKMLQRTSLRGRISEGLYELRLINLEEEKKGVDSTITNIRINTDKIVTQGTILQLDNGTLFFELRQNAVLKFYAVHKSAVQNIEIRGSIDKDVLITEDMLNKWVPVELPPGRYSMSIKGDLYVSGSNFAFTEDSFFQLYDYEINSDSSDWVIISDYQVEKDKKGWITARKVFTNTEFELLDNRTLVFGLRKNDKSEVMMDEFKVSLIQK
jgi:hypothetical protein